MHNAPRRAHVRIPERRCLLPDDWVPDSMNTNSKANDSRAIARIQGYEHGGLFGQVVALEGVTLNGQPVKLLVLSSQAKDLLDHSEMVESVGQFDYPENAPKFDLRVHIKRQLSRRSIEVD